MPNIGVHHLLWHLLTNVVCLCTFLRVLCIPPVIKSDIPFSHVMQVFVLKVFDECERYTNDVVVKADFEASDHSQWAVRIVGFIERLNNDYGCDVIVHGSG
jgi:hypothetical protein